MKDTYTADEVRELCLHSFKVGMRIGERRARAELMQVHQSTASNDAVALRLIQGGVR